MLAFALTGCGLMSHAIKDTDKHTVEITADNPALPLDCLAGFYSGIAFTTENMKILKAITALDQLADKESKDYKRCKSKGLQISILAIAGEERAQDVVSQVMKMGVIP